LPKWKAPSPHKFGEILNKWQTVFVRICGERGLFVQAGSLFR
ncbi:MAG: hypothetical protein ACI814_002412, partial [Mariniblastus sp.]